VNLGVLRLLLFLSFGAIKTNKMWNNPHLGLLAVLKDLTSSVQSFQKMKKVGNGVSGEDLSTFKIFVCGRPTGDRQKLINENGRSKKKEGRLSFGAKRALTGIRKW